MAISGTCDALLLDRVRYQSDQSQHHRRARAQVAALDTTDIQAMSATMQIIPSSTAEDAIGVFSEMLENRAGANLDDAYCARDWRPVWHDLVTSGWTTSADGATAGGDGDFTLLDLTAIA